MAIKRFLKQTEHQPKIRNGIGTLKNQTEAGTGTEI